MEQHGIPDAAPPSSTDRQDSAAGPHPGSDDGRGSGWRAELDLAFACIGNRTALARREHKGPLRVLRAFYPEGPVCHVYVVHPPGGVVSGDTLSISIEAQAGSQAVITTPAAGKFYRSSGAAARQSVDIHIADNASVEWLPQETIYYSGARVRQQTAVHLNEPGSRFIGWEVGCFGLTARGEGFESGRIMQGFEVWRGARPLLLDRLRLEGGAPMMQARWGLAGNTVLGTFVACPATREDVEVLRECEAGSGGENIAMTLVDGVLVVRCLAGHADAVTRRFVALWRVLRPRLMQRPAVLPRIWAT